MNPLLQLPPWLFLVISVGATILLFNLGLSFKQKFFPGFFISQKDNPGANVIYYLVSTMLSIILALILITVWNDYEEQRKNTGKEACVLGNLYRDARGLDARAENEIQQLIINYTTEIVQDGWPAMEEERESRKAWMAFNKLYGVVIRFEPETNGEKSVFSKMIVHMNQLANYRRLRLIRSAVPVLPPVLQWSIIVSSFITIVFSYLIRVENKRMEKIMIALVGAILGLVFSLIIVFNSPYKGKLKVSPFPIENLLNDVFPMADITQAKI